MKAEWVEATMEFTATAFPLSLESYHKSTYTFLIFSLQAIFHSIAFPVNGDTIVSSQLIWKSAPAFHFISTTFGSLTAQSAHRLCQRRMRYFAAWNQQIIWNLNLFSFMNLLVLKMWFVRLYMTCMSMTCWLKMKR